MRLLYDWHDGCRRRVRFRTIGKKAAGAIRVQLSYDCRSRVRLLFEWHEGCMSRVRLLYEWHEGCRSRVRLLYDWHLDYTSRARAMLQATTRPVAAIAVSCIHNYAHCSKLQTPETWCQKARLGVSESGREKKKRKKKALHCSS